MKSPKRSAGGDGSGAADEPGGPQAGPSRSAVEGSPFRSSEIDAYFADHHVDDYAGLQVNGPSSVEVRLVHLSVVRRRQVCAMFPEVTISFAPAWYSTAAASRLRDEITADWHAWKKHGVQLLELSIDAYGLVVAGVRDPSSAEHQLLDRYGDARIRVEQGDEVEI